MKKIILLSFVVMAIAQWTVPLNMLWSRILVQNKGDKLKFRTRPVDPADVFKGRYIYLSFLEDQITLNTSVDYQNGQEVFLTFDTTADGYAKISKVFRVAPAGNRNFLEVRVQNAYRNSAGLMSMRFDYPFRQYYMEETKAPKAEKVYRDSAAFANKMYALVSVHRGRSVLDGVYVNGIRIEALLPE